MTKSRLHFLVLLISALILQASCSPQPSNTIIPNTPIPEISPTPFTVTDGLGRSISLQAYPQRIVSLAPSNTEILYAIGAGDRVVGRDEFSDYPPEAKNLPSVGGGFGDYNNEAIVQLKPDLVLAAEINTPEQVKALEDLGVTIYYLSNPTTLDEMFSNLATVAQLTGNQSEAETLVASLQERVKAVNEKIMPLSYRPSVFYELDATDPNAPYTAGSDTFVNTLIDMAGGFNIASDIAGQYLQMSSEELLVRNPSVILLGDAAYGVSVEDIKARPGWSQIAAVMNDQIFTFDDNLVSRPGPRLVDGLEELVKLLHPGIMDQ
jgi:iron complex transport system substrate-binding protein